jgi:sarcosine oxidase
MFDVIVIGVGTMGAAACECLARRGGSVLGLEQFTIPHNRGSHHGKSRVFRTAYYEHPDYVPLLRRAYDGWRALQEAAGVRLLHEVGALYLGKPGNELIAGSIDSARRHGLPHRELTREEVARDFPQFNVPEDFVGFLDERAGWLEAERAVKTMSERAIAAGATVREGQRVLGWNAAGPGITVRVEGASYESRALVVTAGAWTSKVLEDLGLPLVVSRQVFGWVRPRDGSLFRGREGGGGFPCWGIGYDDGTIHYGFPMVEGEDTLKIALHARGTEADPDRLDRAVAPQDEATFRAVLDGMLPSAAGPTVRTCVCMYTNSPDSHFIIDRHPEHPNVVFACGFSGHGFKFAPVIGEVLADLAIAGRTEQPLDFLSLRRFRP